MIYKDVDRNLLIKDIPHTIYYLESVDEKLKSEGIELTIRDTDDVHASIILDYPCNEKEKIADILIREYLGSHCCKCGCHGNIVNQQHDDDYAYPLNCICEECSVKEKGFHKYIIFQIKKQSNDTSYRAKHIKLKLKIEEGKFIYRFADEVRFRNNDFVVKSNLDRDKDEIVKIVGADLGLRDINDERVYTGDILLAENDEGHRFWGMVTKEKSGWKDLSSPNPQWENYSLAHGWGNFPSPLSHATKFKIIDSVGSIKNFDGKEVSDGHYMQWCEENTHINMREIQL